MKLLDDDGLKAKGVTYTKVHLWRLVKAGKFPPPIKIGNGRNAWVDHEIDQWIAERIAERDATSPPQTQKMPPPLKRRQKAHTHAQPTETPQPTQ
jgi:prophage regulatory protein